MSKIKNKKKNERQETETETETETERNHKKEDATEVTHRKTDQPTQSCVKSTTHNTVTRAVKLVITLKPLPRKRANTKLSSTYKHNK